MSPRNRHFRPALLLAAVALALTGACADPILAADPIPLTNVVCLVYGEEVENETPRIGHVFVREDFDGSFRLCFGDGDTPGGILLARLDDLYPYADPYNLTNTVRFNGNILQLGPHYAIRAPRGSLAITYDSIPALRIATSTNAAVGPALSYAYDSSNHVITLSADYAPSADMSLVVSTNLLDAGSWVPCTNATVSYPDPLTIQWQVSSTNILGGASVYFFAIDSDATAAGAIHADLPLVAEQGITMGGEHRTTWPSTNGIPEEIDALESRMDALEMPDTCRLYWSTGYVASNWNASSNIDIPIDFPTRRLVLVVSDDEIPNLTLNLPWNAVPSSTNTTIDIYFIRENTRTASGYTDRNSVVKYRNSTISFVQANNQHRRISLFWDALLSGWQAETITMAMRPYYCYGSRTTFPSDWPETVEAWQTTLNGQRNAAQAQTLSQGPSPMMPSVLTPSEDNRELLDGGDNLDELAGLGAEE